MMTTTEAPAQAPASYLAGNELDADGIAKDYRPTEARTWLRLFIDVLMLVVGIIGSVMAMDFVPLARYFALFASAGVTVVASVNLVADLWHTTKGVRRSRGGENASATDDTSGDTDSEVSDNGAVLDALKYFGSMLAAAVGIAIFGLPVAGAIFVFLFLKIGAGWRTRSAIFGGLGICLGTITFGFFLDMRWPASLLALEQYIMQLIPF